MSTQINLKEIEIKLYASANTLADLRKEPLFRKHSQQAWQTKELLNQYMDTPDQVLTAAKVALRVRQDANQYIQTLKAKGHSIGGFAERDEFNWIIASPQLDLSLLNKAHWPESLANLDKSRLMTIFSTDFTRNCILVQYQQSDEMAEIEVALDSGYIKTANRQEPLSELELELREGSATTLLDFAIVLANQYPLMPSDTSKAERGYRLLNADAYQLKLAEKPTKKASTAELLHYYLATSQRLLEHYLWQTNLTVLASWVEQLNEMAMLLQPIAEDDLFNLLMPILKDWQTNLVTGDERLLDNKMKQELKDTRWGVFSLTVSRWLLRNRIQ